MPDSQKQCRLCGENAQCKPTNHRRIYRYVGCACGEYFAHDLELLMADNDIKAGKYRLLPSLLNERMLRGGSGPLLIFKRSELGSARENITFADSIPVDDLLHQWPKTVPERIDRCLRNLANLEKEAGETIALPVGKDKKRDTILFAATEVQARYYVQALVHYGWVSNDKSHATEHVLVITPDGWERIRELGGGHGRARNPAFVAMWFGGAKQRDSMRELFANSISPAIKAAGYHVKRADTDEHNDPIMDRVIDDIRRAPFVVAELTKNITGVYYEAGFAKGEGVEVIFCRKKKQRVHFDVSGINQVVYQSPEDLKIRLENRVLGTLGPGPISK